MTDLSGFFADPMTLAHGAAIIAAAGAVDVSSATDYAAGRQVLYEAFSQVMNRAPSAYELQAIQAIALHETGMGQIGQFAGSHNWGAVQCPGTWGAEECPPGCTMGKDSTPTTRSKPVCFRSYPDDVAGAVDLVRNLTIARPRTLRTLASGDADAIAGAMYAERYYTGTSSDPAQNIALYAGGIARRAAELARGLAEPLRVQRYRVAPPSAGPALGLASAFALVALRRHLMSVAGDQGAPVVTGDVGDWIPTFVTADDAKRYVREYDAQWERVTLDVERIADKIPPELKQSWSIDLEAWRKFRDDAIASTTLWNARATMEQADRWAAKLIEWRKSLEKANVPITGPGPVVPGQGLGGEGNSLLGSGWAQLALLVAALFGAGYLVRGFRP
jgi:hypothetical protein